MRVAPPAVVVGGRPRPAFPPAVSSRASHSPRQHFKFPTRLLMPSVHKIHLNDMSRGHFQEFVSVQKHHRPGGFFISGQTQIGRITYSSIGLNSESSATTKARTTQSHGTRLFLVACVLLSFAQINGTATQYLVCCHSGRIFFQFSTVLNIKKMLPARHLPFAFADINNGVPRLPGTSRGAGCVMSSPAFQFTS